jgi:hypothetical protein
MASHSLTNITFPQNERVLLREAIEHYGFENLNQFFRICAHTLIRHYQRGDKLSLPLVYDRNGGLFGGQK